MATPESIARRRAEAEARVQTAVSALAAHHEVEILDNSYPVRDLELKRVIQLESFADALEQITAKANNKTAEPETETEPETAEEKSSAKTKKKK